MDAIKCNDTLAISIHRVRNSDLNEHGTVYGGRTLELIDGQASVAAMRVARTTVATASMDHIQFLQPFDLQDSMCMEAYVTGFGRRSIEVFTKVIGEHLMTGERFLGFTSFMTFVILDAEKQVDFDRLIPESAEQKALVASYSQRVADRKEQRQKQQDFLSQISITKPWAK
ncbi:acyl-CoA thioesterase [Limosilactobacillus sp. STM2_1]|uniref:Acyl-CoA thioesterase n=1 Tax=Limosilactobacillus rudii TaxID=2759755 RepID=A0A7W3UMT1_9LACO|nr:acyl-CoA thioesterase [Limosilactobacillus rudii]MBB1080350.1 acyl-CoA thioesterase [Limosilactobacillus rudii]MBB1098376.1 acyl-CoA thioesterase [Limosilactobacillus rudii]MCD7135384.1 acyl-CoA thioesterase [Limosilactobacillus rudii]